MGPAEREDYEFGLGVQVKGKFKACFSSRLSLTRESLIWPFLSNASTTHEWNPANARVKPTKHLGRSFTVSVNARSQATACCLEDRQDEHKYKRPTFVIP
ncbi:hypothetical protein CEP52_017504 [Fusarium oligoseptatum]|uniref:Uncharacterized protein n=1 Tax=Fusarium oligoseptatum TaxID=2604345 RepID=A0A428RPV4_9HYPO|nr:hypothetical protein CEP52_017504 [Fusarium oligoseptatum]